MAKGSGIGEIIGLGIAGVGVWWIGGLFGWWGGTTTTTTTTVAPPAGGIVPATTPMPTTPTPAATVTMNGSPSATINNALKASFTINGQTQNIAVIPNGDAYNDAGQDITSTLAAMGVTPSQLYSMMSASYVAPVAPSTPLPATGTALPAPLPARTGAIRRATGRGMAGPMVFARQGNYLRKSGV